MKSFVIENLYQFILNKTHSRCSLVGFFLLRPISLFCRKESEKDRIVSTAMGKLLFPNKKFGYIGGSKLGARDAQDPISFSFMQFSAKI